jgi:hypothetical protein
LENSGCTPKSVGHWKLHSGENSRKFLENFAKTRNFDPLVAENWYCVLGSLVNFFTLLCLFSSPPFPLPLFTRKLAKSRNFDPLLASDLGSLVSFLAYFVFLSPISHFIIIHFCNIFQNKVKQKNTNLAF